MKDIDFDELDKAVSSVLAQGAAPAVKADPVKDQPADAGRDEQPDALSDERPASEEIPVEVKKTAPLPTEFTVEPDAVESESSVADQPASSEASPRITMPRKSGRFMDMVHPSSDMSGQKTVVAPTQRVSMAGRTLQPLSSSAPAIIDAEEPPVLAVEEPEEPQEAVHDVAPLDEPSVPLDLSEAPAPVAEQPAPVLTPEPPTPTPFLSDAKVEKRPLGAFAETPAPTEDGPKAPVPDSPVETKAPADAALMPLANAQEQADRLPPELDSDIVSVESDASGVDADEARPATAATSAPAVATIAGTLSIPKQYQETERPADIEGHSLFDTEQYHPPLNVHAEHGHRFVWVWVAVAVLLLVGTGALFAYWYVQGM